MNVHPIEITAPDFWHPIHGVDDKINNKKDISRFTYLILLHYFYHNHRFPDSGNNMENFQELIKQGIIHTSFVTTLDKVYKFFQNERLINRYKDEIREHFGYRIFTNQDINQIKNSFSVLFSKVSNKEALKEQLCNELNKKMIERPGNADLEILIAKIQATEEHTVFSKINDVLNEDNKNYIDDYILLSSETDSVCQFLRQDSAASERQSVKAEIKRLEILSKLPIESLGIIGNINVKQRNFYKRRFLTDTPTRSKRRSNTDRYALTAIFCYQRHQEAVDSLIEHLLHFIQQIKKTADAKQAKIDKEVVKRLNDIELLYQMAEINRDHPKGIIEQAVYPAVPQETIDQIINTRDYARQAKKIVRETAIKRYSNIYRGIIFEILDCLNISSNNKTALNSLNLIKQYRNSKLKYYPIEENIPMNGIMSKQEQKNIFEYDDSSNLRILRKEYECALLKNLRVKLRHKEVWTEGAYKYRDPIADLPKDFTEKREDYFALLDIPLLAQIFTSNLKKEMCEKIQAFDQGLPQNKLVNIGKRKGKSWIVLTPLQKVEEPKVIQRVKDTILTKWGIIDLLDILKEVDLRENFTDCFSTAGNREILDRETIRKRLLLCIFALGTNTGLKRTAGASKGSVTFEELRHIRKFFINKDDLREAINTIINSIFRIRNPEIWRSISTACAADSKQFGCFTQNLMTEWSPRHHNSGVMIYWHVNDQYICVYSQLKTCTSSEVASMLQGIIDQETDMEIESQYVDSHGKSELGFALSYLEKFELLPRYKTIGNQKIYLPFDAFIVKNIGEITARSINWQLIEEQYDEMVKHAVALKIGTATAETH